MARKVHAPTIPVPETLHLNPTLRAISDPRILLLQSKLNRYTPNGGLTKPLKRHHSIITSRKKSNTFYYSSNPPLNQSLSSNFSVLFRSDCQVIEDFIFEYICLIYDLGSLKLTTICSGFGGYGDDLKLRVHFPAYKTLVRQCRRGLSVVMMETLVVLDEHRNEYFNRRARGPARFGSAPSGGFRGINCRTFQSGVGILPTPLKGATKRACSSSPKTPSPSVKWHSEESRHLRKVMKSNSIPIPINMNDGFNEGFFFEGFPYSELWAGPAYSNSPPPSSLPIPKFSLCSKRTVSLDLPEKSASDVNYHSMAKSAPASPTRDRSLCFSRSFFNSDDSATMTLRRILNLDIADE